ncbi:serine/threonine-protein kinase MARK2-like [Hyaena hyaena]|uniref:serine/threonine-protein kinase MARK2-like n=1 Tax=Hyaena hyaena TaxID=95912 RepID=UPI001924C008|nr:serine/threonine-protein kinase MARK2-like [Hyaena hyaena]
MDVKFIRKTQQDSTGLQGLYHEAQNTKTSNHRSIVTSLQVMNTSETLLLFTECVTRDHLEDACPPWGRVAEDVPDKFCQLIDILECCHQQSVFPRDLELQQLLFDQDLKVARKGFGLSIQFAGYKLHIFWESPNPAAPRLFLPQEDPFPLTDVWSLGSSTFSLGSFKTAEETSIKSDNTIKINY